LNKAAVKNLSKTTVMTMVYLVQYLSIIYDMHREHEHTIP